MTRTILRKLGHAVVWAAAVLAVAGTTWAVGAERWSERWGATGDEQAAVLPGDDLIEAAPIVTTRAVTVRVPPEQVWPWIAQFGQGRGGLYSYDWLERLFGIDMASVDTILATEQDVAVGDQLWTTQPGYPADLGHVVADVRPGRFLVLALSTPSRSFAPAESPWTWTFVLHPRPDGTTRLIVRNRTATMGAVGNAIWERVVGPIGFVMERKTMRGIAERAERAAGLDVGWAWREPVWFAGLVITAFALVAIAATRTPARRRAGYVAALTAAATLVMFRFPSAALSTALAAASVLALVAVWRARASSGGRLPDQDAEPLPPRASTPRTTTLRA